MVVVKDFAYFVSEVFAGNQGNLYFANQKDTSTSLLDDI